MLGLVMLRYVTLSNNSICIWPKNHFIERAEWEGAVPLCKIHLSSQMLFLFRLLRCHKRSET